MAHLLPEGPHLEGQLEACQKRELFLSLGVASPLKDVGQQGEISTTPPTGQCYQLTHDYLVPSQREWLTRKQKQTRRGRAGTRRTPCVPRPLAMLRRPPPLSLVGILKWADDHHRFTGSWPNTSSGPVRANLNESWRRIDRALRDGDRGLPGGDSLPRLLASSREDRQL
jgi:hypothetical protein